MSQASSPRMNRSEASSMFDHWYYCILLLHNMFHCQLNTDKETCQNVVWWMCSNITTLRPAAGAACLNMVMFGCLVRFGSLRRSVLSMLQQHFMLLPPWQQGQHLRIVTVASVAGVAWSYWCPILQLRKDGSNHLCTASTVPSRICKRPWQTRANSSYVWLILLYQLHIIVSHPFAWEQV